MKRIIRAGILATVASALVLAPMISAAVPIDTSGLRSAVTLAGVREHQQALQAIADANDDTRVAGSSGYDDSANYVKTRLLAAGFAVTEQSFDFPFFQELTEATLDQIVPDAVSYEYGVDFLTMDYSGSGDVTAAVQAVDLLLPPTGGSTSGCEAADFPTTTAGSRSSSAEPARAVPRRSTPRPRVQSGSSSSTRAMTLVVWISSAAPSVAPT